jgi:hypothetical protein
MCVVSATLNRLDRAGHPPLSRERPVASRFVARAI